MYKYLVEFLGTVFFISAVAFSGNPLYVVTAFTIGLALAGKISGAHFNPAVSTWAWLSSKLSTVDFGMYVLAQTSAGLLVWVLSELSS